jgi:hypothetical protein
MIKTSTTEAVAAASRATHSSISTVSKARESPKVKEKKD